MIIKTGLISNIAFEVFGIPIYWYAILIVTGMILALVLCKIYDGRYGVKFDSILNLAIVVLPVAIICARLYYVAFSWKDYCNSLQDIFKIKDGGLAIYGGLLGGLAVILVYCRIKKINPLNITDYIVPRSSTCTKYRSMGKLY